TTFEAEIEPRIQQAAYNILPELVPQPDDETPPAGWRVLHTGATGAYPCASSWVWGNVVEMRSAAGERYLGCPDTDPEHFVRSTAGGSAASGSWRRSATSDRPGCGTFSSQTCLT